MILLGSLLLAGASAGLQAVAASGPARVERVAVGEKRSGTLGPADPLLAGRGPSRPFEFVAEADESDGAFLVYRPFAALVTNVDADHLDVWGSEAAYRAAFADFVATVDDAGFVVVCSDDPGARFLASVARDRGLDAVIGHLDPARAADQRVVRPARLGRQHDHRLAAGADRRRGQARDAHGASVATLFGLPFVTH